MAFFGSILLNTRATLASRQHVNSDTDKMRKLMIIKAMECLKKARNTNMLVSQKSQKHQLCGAFPSSRNSIGLPCVPQ